MSRQGLGRVFLEDLFPMYKAFDTRSDLSQTTCWVRQNLRMSGRVLSPKAYDTRCDMSYTMVSNGVLESDTRSDILRFCVSNMSLATSRTVYHRLKDTVPVKVCQ